jgi:hypothetical protein
MEKIEENHTLEKVSKIENVEKLISNNVGNVMGELSPVSIDDGLLVKVFYEPSKNHIHVEANIQDGDELVLMMLRKAYDAWKKRVYEKMMENTPK